MKHILQQITLDLIKKAQSCNQIEKKNTRKAKGVKGSKKMS